MYEDFVPKTRCGDRCPDGQSSGSDKSSAIVATNRAFRQRSLVVSHYHMGRTLKVHLIDASPDLVHDFRNFGKDIYRALRDNYAVSIAEIDASTREFHLRDVPKREVRTVASRVWKLVERYTNLVINVDEIREGDDG